MRQAKENFYACFLFGTEWTTSQILSEISGRVEPGSNAIGHEASAETDSVQSGGALLFGNKVRLAGWLGIMQSVQVIFPPIQHSTMAS